MKCSCAADGKAGVDAAKNEKPDVILMDMNMPELDGWEATRQIKAEPASAGDSCDRPDRPRHVRRPGAGLAAGCTDYHTKPIEFPKLLGQIEAVLQKTNC